jgi:hypothetical protein
MKTNLNEMKYGLTALSNDELSTVNGGGFWGTVGYIIGATAKSIYIFTKSAADYQASLPANLKK